MSSFEAEEWVIECWHLTGWVRSYNSMGVEEPVRSFTSAARMAKRKELYFVFGMPYRIRNIRTGDILPAAIL